MAKLGKFGNSSIQYLFGIEEGEFFRLHVSECCFQKEKENIVLYGILTNAANIKRYDNTALLNPDPKDNAFKLVFHPTKWEKKDKDSNLKTIIPLKFEEYFCKWIEEKSPIFIQSGNYFSGKFIFEDNPNWSYEDFCDNLQIDLKPCSGEYLPEILNTQKKSGSGFIAKASFEENFSKRLKKTNQFFTLLLESQGLVFTPSGIDDETDLMQLLLLLKEEKLDYSLELILQLLNLFFK